LADADLVFRREVPPRRATDVLYDLFGWLVRRHGFLPHLRSLRTLDEPEILPPKPNIGPWLSFSNSGQGSRAHDARERARLAADTERYREMTKIDEEAAEAIKQLQAAAASRSYTGPMTVFVPVLTSYTAT
jgi:hypothetical protein